MPLRFKPAAHAAVSSCVALLTLTLAGCSGGHSHMPPGPPDADHDSVVDADDCAPNDATRWQLLAFQSADLGLAGHRVAPGGMVCSGTALPATHSTQVVAALDQDCDDANATRWRLMTVYADADADGVGAGAGSVACVGTQAAQGFSLTGYDPVDNPANPAATTTKDFDLPQWLLRPPHIS